MIKKVICPITGSGWMLFVVFVMFTALAANAIEFELPIFNYGKLERDRNVNQIFQTYKVLPDHSYYISGPENIPHAIIGVHRNYELRPGLWQAVKVTTPLLRSWISRMDNVYGYPPYGSVILDNKGQRIGIWYSSKQWTTVIIDKNNQIAILTPETPGFRGGN